MGVPDMDEPSFTDSELDYHVRNALKAAIQVVLYNVWLGQVDRLSINCSCGRSAVIADNFFVVSRVTVTFITSLWQ